MSELCRLSLRRLTRLRTPQYPQFPRSINVLRSITSNRKRGVNGQAHHASNNTRIERLVSQ